MRHRTFPQAIILMSGLLAAAGPLFADTSTGPDPYATGYGFTTPELADWGGWRRGDAGTLYAEWDVFDDQSHGEATDRSAAPDLGSAGLSSAWLGWNAGTFATGSGNLYSFSVPEAFSVELAGTLPAAPVRVALQVETQGHVLNPDSFTLNGALPDRNERTYRDEAYPSPMGPTDLVHRLLVWELPAPPDSFAFSFAFASDEPHLSLTQVAVDVGSVEPTETPTDPDADRTVRIGLPAEPLDGEFAASLHAQYPAWFPAGWSHRELIFARQTDASGQRVVSTLKGDIKALYYDEAAGGATNQVYADLYRPNVAGDVKIAECRLKGVKKRRWVRIEVDGQPARLSVGRYRLDLKAVESAQDTPAIRLKQRAGQCDVDLATDGVQPGMPELLEGDYAVFRRVGG